MERFNDMNKNKISKEQLEMRKVFEEHLDKQFMEEKQEFDKQKQKAPLIGKEPFNLQELKKSWSFRFENKLNEEQINRAMQEIERDYYLAGNRFMTMEQYGKYLMEMELYR